MHDENDNAALEQVLAASGVKVTSQDADAVARALARINSAAAAVLASLSFDDTIERYYRLLENDLAEGSGA